MIALILIGIVFAFFLPLLIGLLRDVEGKDTVFWFTVLGVFTAGAGWAGALLLACRLPKRLPPERFTAPLPVIPPHAGHGGPPPCPACGQNPGQQYWQAAS